jgi:hypothetical protein
MVFDIDKSNTANKPIHLTKKNKNHNPEEKALNDYNSIRMKIDGSLSVKEQGQPIKSKTKKFNIV